MIELSRYSLEVLGSDKDFNLYRGSSDYDGSQILVLSPAADYPTPETLRRLEHEYSIRDELDSAWAARPIEFTEYGARTVLVLQDPGGIPLDQLLGSIHNASSSRIAGRATFDLSFWLCLAVNLSGVIGRLHQHGIIHKDIKPANVLTNPGNGHCWLKGFGIASRLRRERQPAEPPELVAGTLAYMAPEQTGRMNRSIDCRSDLYALGVSLYEMLTGTLPFRASDPMEWVHCHIARKPVPPQERSSLVPAPVSAIVMKLLAKTAEERYQTAAGVEADFRRCLDEWERGSDSAARSAIQTGRSTPIRRYSDTPAAGIENEDEYEVVSEIPEFRLGEHDVPDQLLTPERLYGRGREIESLLASFERVVATGRSEFLLVSGYSGIGKSSVVNELHKALVPSRGLFTSGKFDQYKRDIPYSTLAQAFQGLIRPILGRSDVELSQWRDAFREALGPNGQLIVDLIPELALILDRQPPVQEMAAPDAQRRFRFVFRRFISVFARSEHPLVLFLDDLQWVDAATLDLLEDLSTRPDVQHLMLIGAYRDNEVDRSHPLVQKLESIRQAGSAHEIVLNPLSSQDLGRLIADSLHCEPEDERSEQVTPLAQLVHEKTGGNPFFAIQFLSALAEEGLLTFDRAAARWSWDLASIHAKAFTDNVVDLMAAKLNRLPIETQKTLKEFACLGNSAELETLSIVHGTSEEQLESDLWEALRLEFVVRLEGSYKFVHDRIQEAAYSLIPETSRAETHLRMGRLLAAQTPSDKLEEEVFEIVNQLNRGAFLISSEDERERLAELNLMAGRRARVSTAYSSALKYFVAGASLLPADIWARRHELAFTLELCRAECEFLTGELAAAEERLTTLSSRAASTVERATVECLRIDLYTKLDQTDRAVAVCLDYLRRLGIEWSPHPTQEEARREYDQIWIKLGSRMIEDLVELPSMSDPDSLATLDVLTKVYPSALTDTNFLSMAVCRAVNLSLERGHSDGSCAAYEFFAKIAGPYFGDYKAGFRFGQLGYDLVERHGWERFRAQTYLWFGQFVLPWTKHIQRSRALFWRAFEAATKTADITFAVYSFDNLNTNFLAAGDPLIEAQRQAENGLEVAQRMRFGHVIDIITTQLGLIRTLRGLTYKFGSFNDGQFSEASFEQHVAGNRVAKHPECWYWIRKLQARFLAGDYSSALDAAGRASELLWSSAAMFETAEYHLYAALARAAANETSTLESGRAHCRALTEHHKQLELWAENCPQNFENRAALVGAEIARVEGRELDAERLYEQAIRSARLNGFIHNEALANETAGRFYLVRGFEKIANAYLRDARYCYLRWGADGKVRQLDEFYPQLREEERAPGPTSTIGAPVEHLDLATVIKVSQAVSGEIVFGKLIDTLMRTAIEHAGAERGLLIIPRGVEQRIEAEAVIKGESIIVSLREAPMTDVSLPESIVHYVARTHESVILDDASAQNPFSTDSYIRQHDARSILCLPLVNQGKLTAVLYLENNLTPHVFTPTRIAVLKLLASQAAISLERKRAEEAAQKAQAELAHVARVTALGELTASIAHEVNQPLGAIVNYGNAGLRFLKAGSPDLTQIGTAFSAMVADANRASAIIARIRALSKKSPPELAPLQIKDLVTDTQALVQHALTENRIALKTTLAGDLSPVLGDRIQLQQVLLNLVVNSIEAMKKVPYGRRQLSIEAQSQVSEEKLFILITVTDSGIGLKPEDLPKLFETFYTTKEEGMGMGLAISRSIVEAHGGRLWATPNTDVGATFQFMLPAQNRQCPVP